MTIKFEMIIKKELHEGRLMFDNFFEPQNMEL